MTTMTRREFHWKAGAAGLTLAATPGLLLLEGCPSQNTVAALVSTLGNAAASIAKLEGNSSLALKLTADTTAAVSAITNWKTGSPAQMAIQAMNLVIDDLFLFPDLDPYAPLIVLAIGTAESIITILVAGSPAGSVRVTAPKRKVDLDVTPKTEGDFKKQWNQIVGEHRDWRVAKL